jgi:uncharacterized protein
MYNFFEKNHTRSIHDPIHGTIKLSDLEIDIIEHSLFRRLHHIRQNSFLYKVFPTAKHTRFDHSIGVMHMAGKMFKSLIENSEIASIGNDLAETVTSELLNFHSGVGVNLNEILNNNSEDCLNIYREIRVAALLHDIGHGPLSHLFDSYAPSIEEFVKIINSDESINSDVKCLLIAYLERMANDKTKSEVRIEHEHVSLFFIAIILEELKKRYDFINSGFIKSVLGILKPDLINDQYILKYKGLDFDFSLLLNDIVASAPIDCDRMDYLKRDSYFTGVPYGNYSEQRVLKTLLPYVDNNFNLRLGLKTSGLHAVENFLLARYELYVQVYGHKTNEACNAMLNSLKDKKLSFSDWAEEAGYDSIRFQKLYIELTDEEFLNRLLSKLDEESQKTLFRLVERDLWKRVFEIVEFVEDPRSSSEVSIGFDESFELLNREFSINKFVGNRYPLKDLNFGAKLLDKKNHSFYVLAEKELEKASQIIESLNKGQIVRRFYTTEKDLGKINEMKKKAQETYLSKVTLP